MPSETPGTEAADDWSGGAAASARRPYRGPEAQALARLGMTGRDRLQLRVVGDSMAPLLRPGDAIALAPVAPAALRRGDILVLSLEGSLVTHRLVGRVGAHFVAKGDNRAAADPPIAADQILGRVEACLRGSQRCGMDRGCWPAVNRLLGGLGAFELWLAGQVGDGPAARAGLRPARAAIRRLQRLLVHAAIRRARGGSGGSRD